jgi:hypothetical protein
MGTITKKKKKKRKINHLLNFSVARFGTARTIDFGYSSRGSAENYFLVFISLSEFGEFITCFQVSSFSLLFSSSFLSFLPTFQFPSLFPMSSSLLRRSIFSFSGIFCFKFSYFSFLFLPLSFPLSSLDAASFQYLWRSLVFTIF